MSYQLENEDTFQRIRRCKMKIMQTENTAFFTGLLCQKKIIVDESTPTACTDGLSIWFNPYFCDPLGNPQLLGLTMHELGHIIFDHITICQEDGLDHNVHNQAGDHYINLWLLDQGFELPDGALADPKYRVHPDSGDRWSTRQIYNDLMKNPQKQKAGFVSDIMAPPKGMTPEEHKGRVGNSIIQATMAADQQGEPGSVPGDVRRWVEDVLNPELPWHHIFANYMDDYNDEDYSMARVSRRYLPDFYLPTLHSPGITQITAGFDVSYSIDEKILSLVWKEIEYVWLTMGFKQMRIMSFDTEVHMNELLNEGETMDHLEITGGGGTNVVPLLESIAKEEPRVAVIFTDGGFHMPDMSNIDTDVIWILSEDDPSFDPPKGRVIRYNGVRSND